VSGKTVLIVGGSIAGLEHALEQARAGNKVYLVEESTCLASERIVPDKEPSGDHLFVSPKLEELKNNKNIQIISGAEIEKATEQDGKFRIKIRHRALRVLAERCDDCKACISVCPVNLWDDANHHLSFRTAIDSPGAGGGIYNIIRENMPVCQETCPLHLDIRGYIGLIADGKFAEALALIREKLPFPGVIARICPHPCEEECNRGIQDEPLSICGLKRFVADFELQELGKPKVPAKGAAREVKVAIVGAGPAGLTCAHDLASLGYRVIIFESLPVPGGMLAVGIPEYRLPKAVLQKEIDVVRALGVEIKLNTTIGKDLTIDDLFRQDFKAVFIGVGAHQSQKLMVPGEDTKGVVHGIDFLRNLNLGREVWVGEKVTIIGGGNVAIDAARSALRLGAKEVSILYRRSRQEMLAYSEEIEAAEAEGVRIHYLVAPAGVLTSSGEVKGLCCTRMELGEPDALGRRQAILVRGSEFDIASDMIILAIGQVTALSFLGQNSRIKTARGSTLVADPETMATTRPGVFAGGDAVTGPGIAVEAIAAGKRAAISIAKYLEKE